ncbi:MAG: hypothetical protein IPK04_17595 [Bdellovibrionales bacterium]|nr:hypothetical protein [Bdellovibrionales bacterium]
MNWSEALIFGDMKRHRWDDGAWGLLQPIYESVSRDMRALNGRGLLSYANYDVVYLTDGYLSPQVSAISDVLKFYAPQAGCAANKKTCVGICSALVQKMETSWEFLKTTPWSI